MALKIVDINVLVKNCVMTLLSVTGKNGRVKTALAPEELRAVDDRGDSLGDLPFQAFTGRLNFTPTFRYLVSSVGGRRRYASPSLGQCFNEKHTATHEAFDQAIGDEDVQPHIVQGFASVTDWPILEELFDFRK